MNWLRLSDLRPYNPFPSEFNQLYGDFFEEGYPRTGYRTPQTSPRFPAVNVWDDPERFYAEAELPGLKLEDLDITVVDDELTLSGTRVDREGEGANFHRRERGVGEFRRTLRLPVDIEVNHVEANLKDGILRIALPKAEEAKPRKIEIKIK